MVVISVQYDIMHSIYIHAFYAFVVSDTVIIVITVCVALVVLASIIALICQWKR